MVNAASAPNYGNNKDIRYASGDEVSFYHLNRAADGTLDWSSALQRTLKFSASLSVAAIGLSGMISSILY